MIRGFFLGEVRRELAILSDRVKIGRKEIEGDSDCVVDGNSCNVASFFDFSACCLNIMSIYTNLERTDNLLLFLLLYQPCYHFHQA